MSQAVRSPEGLVRHNHRTAARKESVKQIVDLIKTEPCMDCGQSYAPYVMDFDHVRGEKVANVGRLVTRGKPLNMIMDEIDKCDLVCANCHRGRTHGKEKT